MGRTLSLAFSLSAFVLVAGCSGKDPYSPGTKLGVFHVTAKLVTTTCGPTPDPWEFDVRLNHEAQTVYWVQGGAPIQGIVDATTARTELTTVTTHDVRPADARARRPACAIVRSDVLAVTLADAEARPAGDPSRVVTFSGALVYGWTPTEGSDCADQVTGTGGDFASLPCEVRYEVTGAFKSAAP